MEIKTFGLIADVQYADIPDGISLHTGKTRYFSSGISRLKAAIADFKANGISSVIQLGDLIDAHCGDESLSRIREITDIMDGSGLTWMNVLGNHEIANLSRDDVLPILFQDNPYYHRDIGSGFELVVLDNYDISVLGHHPSSEKYRLAEGILNEHNPNSNKNQNDNIPDRRYTAYNGMIGKEQLVWLDNVLDGLDGKKNVIIAGEVHFFPTFLSLLLHTDPRNRLILFMPSPAEDFLDFDVTTKTGHNRAISTPLSPPPPPIALPSYRFGVFQIFHCNSRNAVVS